MSRTVTMRGNPLTLAGEELKVGDKAPEATLRKNLLQDWKVSESTGTVRIFSVVPSINTPVCAEQTRRFNKAIAELPGVNLYAISCDLPMAQRQFCGAENLSEERFMTLSDYKDVSFATAYGTLIPFLRLNCRAVFVIDKDDTIRYAEYVPEISEHPKYEAILECAKSLASAS